jgi:methionyl-tRNA synthetase
MTRRILVTSALPYANGPIHLGHLVEYIQTDIWVRYQRLSGNRCVYMCADDTHGTSIMIRARKEGTTEMEIITNVAKDHGRDFAEFGISFDHYSSTHSPYNRAVCNEIWAALKAEGAVERRNVDQLYDPEAQTFLADRFVKGECPRCGSPNQYGDNCDKCGATYTPADLKNPKSTLSGAVPELRTAEHLFINVESQHAFLDNWTQTDDHLEPSVANYLRGYFLGQPLRDWDISRPAPYFGFEIPDEPGQYFYVWFDAPIGYIGATREWCASTGEDFNSWWRSDDTEVHHFIGKDITYFHTLFWPAMLRAAKFNLPRKVHIHGFLTVQGEKMSKSKGTFVMARTYLNHLDPAYLRYFYASKLGPRPEDLDLNLDEFEKKVNSDLVGKVVNLASRTARFMQGQALSAIYPNDGGLFAEAAHRRDEIAAAYEDGDFARAMRTVMALADRANEYVDRVAPWTLKKDPTKASELRDVCTIALNLFRQIVVYLAPVLPRLVEQCDALLTTRIQSFNDVDATLLSVTVGTFEHMLTRVDPKKLAAMIEESREGEEPDDSVLGPSDDDSAVKAEPIAGVCSIDDFSKVDLRVARIVKVEAIPEAKKLLKLTLSLGGQERRTIFAGIKAAYTPEALTGRLVVFVANLAPRQMKFGLSEGMIVCASGAGHEGLFVVSPDAGATPGMRLR